jgi:3-hydroxyacyl-CoA dehydrogenase/enoyl-CoA hydratase/carnithine racemase
LSDTVFHLRPIETRAGHLALVTIDNGENWTKPPTLGRSAMASGERLLSELESGDWAAAVFTGKPFWFCAGADIDEFPAVTPETAAEGSRAGHILFERIRTLPFPTVAAINGACLGGGLELALHCSARTVASTVRHLGFPEVFLGLFPAWGGTQVTPRLIGPQAAVQLIVQNPLRQNRLLRAKDAIEIGLADRLLEPVELVDDSIAFALELVERGGSMREEADWSDLETIVRRARNDVDDAVHGATPAPYRALDLIEGAASWTVEEGHRAEEGAIAELLPGDQAQASIYAFDLVERRAKRRPELGAEPGRVRRVGIVGAGLMASQLAALFLRRLEVPVVLRDLDQAIVDRALGAIRQELEGAAARGRMTEDKARFLGSIATGSTSYDGFDDCDLVLEAVVEEMDVKQRVFAELRERTKPGCLLATNTSSLSVGEMGADVGLHFFNPVALMPLVELIRTSATSDEAVATGYDIARGLGKTAVLVRDAPAFVVNRLLTRMTGVVVGSLERGNTVEEADAGIMALGLPMAPSVLMQMVGPRVANHVLGTLHAAYPDRFPLSRTLANFADGNDEIAVAEHDPLSIEEITAAALEALADECGHVLDEGVVGSAKDIDTCMLLGAGFPFFLGGITKHLDQTGVSERVVGRPLAELGSGERVHA